MLALSTALFCTATSPAACGAEVVPQFEVQVGPCWLANGAPRVLKRTPAVAVVALDEIVLLITSTARESMSERPPPSQPATLLVMMLLVTVTVFQFSGAVGNETTSEPLTCWKAMPPPVPASAPFPMIRFALIRRFGPAPSLGPTWPTGVLPGAPPGAPKGAQSASMLGLPLQTMSASGVPITTRPPPLAGIVGFVLWLKMIVLCSMSPFQLNPRWPTPPPSPLVRLPHTQL